WLAVELAPRPSTGVHLPERKRERSRRRKRDSVASVTTNCSCGAELQLVARLEPARTLHLPRELGRRQLRGFVGPLGRVVRVGSVAVDEFEPAGGLPARERAHGNGCGSGFRSATPRGRGTRPAWYAASYSREPPRNRARSLTSSWHSCGTITRAT